MIATAVKEPEVHKPDERVAVFEWRYAMLLGLGFAADDALHLARAKSLDWHEADKLLKTGYTHQQVVWKLEQID